MFKFKVEYLTCLGSMTINTKYYRCKAWTKFGAWLKFLDATADEDHYTDRSRLRNYFCMREDITRGW